MKVVCPNCQAVNNVVLEKAKDGQALCGKCKAKLEPEAPGYPLSITDADFPKVVLRSQKPVLLDLWGPSCPPCRQLAPVLKELAKEYTGKLKVVKLNVEEQQGLVAQFGIRGIPTLLLFREGKEVARTAGFQPLSKLREFVAAGK